MWSKTESGVHEILSMGVLKRLKACMKVEKHIYLHRSRNSVEIALFYKKTLCEKLTLKMEKFRYFQID